MTLPEDLHDLPAAVVLPQQQVIDPPHGPDFGDGGLIEDLEYRHLLERGVALALLVPTARELSTPSGTIIRATAWEWSAVVTKCVRDPPRARSGTVRTPYRIESVPAAPNAMVPAAAAQWMPRRTADDSRTAVHIAVNAARFADGGIPPAEANRSSDGPSQGFSRSQPSNRGELREKQYDAARTKTVVGSPGSMTPAMATATAHEPATPYSIRLPATGVSNHCACPLNASHETLECQFTNVPVGFSFQAQTCSV